MSENYYTVLGIDQSLWKLYLAPDLLKNAYRMALLRYHPDKGMKLGKTGSNIIHQTGHIPSIDEILTAYRVLSDAKTREEYDKQLSISEAARTQSGAFEVNSPGLEIIDLDDMNYDESNNSWSRECRCGTGGGFVIHEADLEKALDGHQNQNSGAIIVGCQGCSLSLKVVFAFIED